jgi:uncharacterized lipoprotein YddW (UPF0748 family)
VPTIDRHDKEKQVFESPQNEADRQMWQKTAASRRINPFKTLVASVIIALTPSIALANARIGVVRGQQNVKQWVTIAERVQKSGVNYCVVDLAAWQSEEDFGGIEVLFVPNIETLNGNQVKSLANWMGKGGKVIVAGPTGNQSTPEVRSQLRGLFGSYWAFSMTAPATLEPTNNEDSQLSSTLTGGAIVPTNTNSQTVAVWLADSKHPAVVVNPKTTYFGWRWGIDTVSPFEFDRAWLQATLKNYGISFDREKNTEKIQFCSLKQNNGQGQPLFPTDEAEEGETDAPTKIPTTPTQPVTPTERYQPKSSELKSLEEELDLLIARFEATLLTAEAIGSSDVDASTGKLVEEFLSDRSRKELDEDSLAAKSKSNYTNTNAYSALVEAKKGRDNFLELWQEKQYGKAKQQWTQTRRLLWDNYPTDSHLGVAEIRGIWLDRGTIVRAKSEADLAKLFDRFAAAGINTIFFETVNASYTIYPSKIAPEQNPLTKGWDPLKAAVKLAHERDMELHAWVWTFAAANQRHNIIIGKPADYLGPVLTANPDWANINNKGQIFDTGKKAFLDPANPEVQRYVSALLKEIATDYEVDGIQLDYIRYPFQDPNGSYSFGYGKAARQLFAKEAGIDPIKLSPRSSKWTQWLNFRIEQIDNFVAETSSNLKQIRPDLKLSVAVFPFKKQERLLKIQQNWEEWARQAWIDFICPMTYAMDVSEFNDITQPLFDRDLDRSKTIFVPGIRLLNLPEIEAIEQMQFLRNLPVGGYALFAAENLNADLENLFNRTQGQSDDRDKSISPLSQPFATVISRYRVLQKEWNFLLRDRQLTLEEPEMREWGTQSDRLAETLQKLDRDPTSGNLASAQLTLSAYRRRFPNWMRQYQQKQPYQVRAWSNRLDSLDRLLSYGEKLQGED